MFDALFSGPIVWFSIPAVLGLAVLLIKLAGLLVGDFLGSVGVDADAIDVSVDGDASRAFELLSITTISTFLMGFGLTGIAMAKGLKLEFLPSAVVGVLGGAGLSWLLGAMLGATRRLHASGNVEARDVVGLVGVVEVPVPVGRPGRGRVRVVVRTQSRAFDAVLARGADAKDSGVSASSLTIGARVKVVESNEDNTVGVRPE